MLKNITLSLLVCAVVLTAGKLLLAGTGGADAQTSASMVIKHQAVGNKVCPVSGEKVGEGGMEPVTYEYEGKIYNFCCVSCIEEFKKDPGKYIKIVEEEMENK